MPDLAGPFDGSTFAQAQWYRDAGPDVPSGVVGPPGDTPAGGELGLTAAGFALTLGLGRARVRGAAYERTGTAWTDTVPANTNPTQARIDRVVLRRSLTAKTVVPVRLQGTPAATPAPPALTTVEDGVWDLPLHRFTVPAASGTPLVITDERAWIVPPISVLIAYTASSNMPNGTLWGPGTPTSFSYPYGPDPAYPFGSFADGFTVPMRGLYLVQWTLNTTLGPTSGRLRVLVAGAAQGAMPVGINEGQHSAMLFAPCAAAGTQVKLEAFVNGMSGTTTHNSLVRVTRVGDY